VGKLREFQYTILIIFVSVRVRMRNCLDKIVQKIKKKIVQFFFLFFRKSCRL